MSENQNKPTKMFNLIIGVTGSVAAIKLTELIEQLQIKFNKQINICVVPTNNALHFLPDTFRTEANSLKERLLAINGELL